MMDSVQLFRSRSLHEGQICRALIQKRSWISLQLTCSSFFDYIVEKKIIALLENFLHDNFKKSVFVSVGGIIDQRSNGFLDDQIINVKDAAILALDKGKLGEGFIFSNNKTQTEDLSFSIKNKCNKKMPRVTLLINLKMALVKILVVPMMDFENIKFGRQHYSCENAKRDLGYAPKDAWLAVSHGYHWHKTKSILK